MKSENQCCKKERERITEIYDSKIRLFKNSVRLTDFQKRMLNENVLEIKKRLTQNKD